MSKISKNEITILVEEFDKLQKKMDNIYSQLAKNSGLSDTAFWIIYTIKNEAETYKQKDLCDIWCCSKQTINSSLKKLEKSNIIELISIPNNKKDKKIVLTEYGKKIATEYIEPVIDIEKRTLRKIKENKEFLELFKKYVDTLENETKKILK